MLEAEYKNVFILKAAMPQLSVSLNLLTNKIHGYFIRVSDYISGRVVMDWIFQNPI